MSVNSFASATPPGFDPARLARADRLLLEWCEAGKIPAAAMCVGRRGVVSETWVWGRQGPWPSDLPLKRDAIFLIASITKPIVALGLLQLVERGLLALDDRVERFLPGFGRQGKHAITLRHLVTHTSGLPDMPPNNLELRQTRAGLKQFVAATAEGPLVFPPGRGVQYQSMGFAVLGEVIARVASQPCAQFLHEQLFAPLGCADTALGAPDDWFAGAQPKIDRVARLRLPPEQLEGSEWNWNSRYWRQLGAPWGGLLTTPADLARMAGLMLGWQGDQWISGASRQAATRNQLEGMREVPSDDRRCRPWGLGWRLNWPAHSANFGDLLGPRTFGHWGATGTVLWLDPDQDAFCLLLTTQPQEPGGEFLARISNIVAASIA